MIAVMLYWGWALLEAGTGCRYAAEHGGRPGPSLPACSVLPWPLSPLLQHVSPLCSAGLCPMPAWRSFSLNAERAKACQN